MKMFTNRVYALMVLCLKYHGIKIKTVNDFFLGARKDLMVTNDVG